MVLYNPCMRLDGWFCIAAVGGRWMVLYNRCMRQMDGSV